MTTAPCNDIFTYLPVFLLFSSNETSRNSGRDASTNQVLTFLLLDGDKQPHKKKRQYLSRKPSHLFFL